MSTPIVTVTIKSEVAFYMVEKIRVMVKMCKFFLMLPKEWSFTKINQFWNGKLFDIQKLTR
jgi:hypothetical protein